MMRTIWRRVLNFSSAMYKCTRPSQAFARTKRLMSTVEMVKWHLKLLGWRRCSKHFAKHPFPYAENSVQTSKQISGRLKSLQDHSLSSSEKAATSSASVLGKAVDAVSSEESRGQLQPCLRPDSIPMDNAFAFFEAAVRLKHSSSSKKEVKARTMSPTPRVPDENPYFSNTSCCA